MKTLEINGVEFEVIRSKDTDYYYRRAQMGGYGSIDDAYRNPSTIKRRVYDSWLNWYFETDRVHDFTITSKSCHCFTIGATYKTLWGERGAIVITKAHNRLYLPAIPKEFI